MLFKGSHAHFSVWTDIFKDTRYSLYNAFSIKNVFISNRNPKGNVTVLEVKNII